MTGTHRSVWPKGSPQSETQTLEFVPKLELDRALEEVQRLREKNERLQRENERLQKQLEEARRSVKRQTTSFSRRKRNAQPAATAANRGPRMANIIAAPFRKWWMSGYVAPLPARCSCGGPAIKQQTKPQCQEEIVRKKIVRQFDVEIGRCACCGKRLQGRHPLQTSDALDAAQVQLGPEALSLATHLNKQLGISYAHAAVVLRIGYGLRLSRAGLCRAVARLSNKAEPTYQAMVVGLRQELVIWMDETGWKVDVVLRWMWVAVSPHFTVYAVLLGRGFAQASQLIGADYAGGLHHDGWVPYYQFLYALHQSCLSHLMRRRLARRSRLPIGRAGIVDASARAVGSLPSRGDFLARHVDRGRADCSPDGSDIGETAVWPNICCMRGRICSPSCTVRIWKRPTIGGSGPSVRRYRLGTSSGAVAPGMAHVPSKFSPAS